ncbi:hypothetical protein GURASL_26000 [Geotalea uraniireducens]|uniref:Lipoprotein n=1 Tax=Geotalea uraniireducens TaxID=351604 RepID=A0ABM8EMN4_9BACT|nr:hypothetical protein [Geotalea uraniireducens]BDV43677.1 hypothetical protein GURASL_26000 [Geotalea uraniireducens]
MRSLVFRFAILLGLFVLTACGSSGGSGGGATTYLTASITNGTSSAAFATYSSVGTLSFTVASNTYTGITPSDVNITKQTLRYTPLPFETYSSGTRERYSPLFTTVPVVNPISLLVPGGSTGKIDNYPVFSWVEIDELLPIVAANPSLYSGKLLKYQLDITFEGYETLTNEPVSTSMNSVVWFLAP